MEATQLQEMKKRRKNRKKKKRPFGQGGRRKKFKHRTKTGEEQRREKLNSKQAKLIPKSLCCGVLSFKPCFYCLCCACCMREARYQHEESLAESCLHFQLFFFFRHSSLSPCFLINPLSVLACLLLQVCISLPPSLAYFFPALLPAYQS